jgi:hypothetical protein
LGSLAHRPIVACSTEKLEQSAETEVVTSSVVALIAGGAANGFTSFVFIVFIVLIVLSVIWYGGRALIRRWRKRE